MTKRPPPNPTPVTNAVIEALKGYTERRGAFPVGNERALQDAIWLALSGFVPMAIKEPKLAAPPQATAHRHTNPDFAVALPGGAAIIEVKLRDYQAGLRQLGQYMQSETTIAGEPATEAILFVAQPFRGHLHTTLFCPAAEGGQAPLTVIDPLSLAL